MKTNYFTNAARQSNALCITIWAAFFSMACSGQSWQWGSSGGAEDNLGNSAYTEQVISMCTAANGDTYTTANVGRIDLQIAGNPKQTYATFGLNDWVIAGFSCDGAYKWSKVIGGFYGSEGVRVGVDANGNVYAACNIFPTAPNAQPANHFDTDVILGSSPTSVNTFKQTIFLIKYDSNGNYLWHQTPQAPDVSRSTTEEAGVFGIEVDPEGNSYMLCQLTPSVYGNGQYTVTTKSFHIVKYDKDGNFTGAFPLDMTINNPPFDFKMKRDPNNGRIYLAGEYTDGFGSNLHFGGQPVTHGKFLAAFNETGALLWEKENTIQLNWGGASFSFDVTVDTDSNIYMIGATGYEGNNTSIIDSFNGVPFVNYGLPPWPFIVKLDPAGNTLWQTNGARSNLVSVTINGNEVGVTSGASQMVWQGVNFTNPDFGQPYIARFQKGNGQIIGINRLVTGGNDVGTVIRADAHGNYYLGGRFSSTVTAGPNTLSSNGGQSDFFIAKFGTNNCNLATEKTEKQDIKPYPNPVRDRLFLPGQEQRSYSLFNSLGVKVLTGTVDTNGAVDMESVAAGVYVLQVADGDGLRSEKIIKL